MTKLNWKGRGLYQVERMQMGLPIDTWDQPTSLLCRFLYLIFG